MADTNSSRWIRFLRQYGPAAQNDSMYDEQIRKLARKLGVNQLAFEHPIEPKLLPLFSESPKATSVILTGTAGDGKSNLCTKIWQLLGGDETQWDSPEIYFQTDATIGGRTVRVHVVRDLTGLPPTDDQGRYESKEQLLQKLSEILFSSAGNEVFVLAANDGQLIETWRRLPASEEVLRARALFDRLLDEDRNEVEGIALRFFHLSRLSSLSLFNLALNAFLAHAGWKSCYAEATEGGFFSAACPIRHNYELLVSPLVQKRLRSLMRLCDHAELHVPIRRILLLLTNSVLGHPDVKEWLMRPSDITKIINDGTVSKASLFNNVFGGNLTDSRRDSLEVFEYLNRFRIGYETSNRVDNILIFGDSDPNLKPYFDSLMAADTFYGADTSYFTAQRTYVEGGDESERVTDEFLRVLVSKRRGLFFKIPENQEDELRLWELTVFKFAGEYLARVVDVLDAGGKVERGLLTRLVKGLNRIFVGMLVEVDRELLLANNISFGGPSVSQVLEDRIPVAPRRNEGIELILDRGRPTLRVQLTDDVTESLRLSLVRYEFLSRVAEGALPGSFSRECYEDLLAFKSKVLAAHAGLRGAEKLEEGTLTFKLLTVDSRGSVNDQVIEVVP